MAQTAELPWWLIDGWIPRKQQIFPCETFAVLVAIHNHTEVMRDRTILWLVDNKSTVGALLKGAARPEDVDDMVGAIHGLCVRHNIRIWFEWVDSA